MKLIPYGFYHRVQLSSFTSWLTFPHLVINTVNIITIDIVYLQMFVHDSISLWMITGLSLKLNDVNNNFLFANAEGLM